METETRFFRVILFMALSAAVSSRAGYASTQVYVSDLPWVRATSYIDTAHRDKNVIGGAISIEGVRFSKGIGVGAFSANDAYSDVVIDISGKGYDLFAAYVGIDGCMSGSVAPSVIFKVLVNGVERATTPVLSTPMVRPYRLVADIRGGDTLVLRLTNGGNGNNGDLASWGDAKLITGELHDVAVTRIDAPAKVVRGTSLNPSVEVRNFGSVSESFDVNCRIDSSNINLYSAVHSVSNLAMYDSLTIGFPAWSLPGALKGDYVFSAVTSLNTDEIRSNDTLKTGFSVAHICLSGFPKQLQLYCRDTQDSAEISINDSIDIAGSDSVSLTIYRNGAHHGRIAKKLIYNGNIAPFSLNMKIHAELSLYKFEFRLDNKLLAASDSVVCGDAFFTEGQSNSTSGSALPPNPFIRTFGPWDPAGAAADSARTVSDTNWGVAGTYVMTPQGPDMYKPRFINRWAARIAQKIIATDSVPVCVMTGGQGGTSFGWHAPSYSLNTIYGKLRYRILKANLQNGLRFVVWHQGEYNSYDTDYKKNFLNLCASWKNDFPGLRQYYLFQVHNGCGGDGLVITREQQRQIPMGRPDISIMSTSGVPGHDGCHFSDAGYDVFADWMYPLIARDFYRSSDTVRITPPEIQGAWYADASHKKVVLQFDQPVVVPADTGIQHAFALGGDAIQMSLFSTPMDSVRADTAEGRVCLYLKNRSDDSAVTYVMDSWNKALYAGPWLLNTRGIGALTFYRFPITDSQTTLLHGPSEDAMSNRLSAVPNPFNPSTTVKYRLAQDGRVQIRVYSIDGRLVGKLVDATCRPGRYQVTWNGRNQNNQALSSGLYILRLESADVKMEESVILLR